MKSDEELLRNAIKWRKPRREYVGASLSGLLEKYLDRKVKPQQRKSSPIVEAWLRVVPEGMSHECRIDKVERGVLTIKVNNPAYVYQFQMLKKELISEMQKHCGRIKIKDIKFVLGRC